jgi:peptidoglycan hydrolase-like protein with peptidoglycan-binding domain
MSEGRATMTNLRPDMDLRAERDTPLKSNRNTAHRKPMFGMSVHAVPGEQTIRRYQAGDFTLTRLMLRKVTAAPARSLTTLAAAGAGLAIFANLTLLQPETHKSPLFPGNPRIHAAPVPTEAPVPVQRPQQLERDAETAKRASLTMEVQNELSARGLFAGPADGQSSPRLTQAIRDFQQGASLPVNGQVSDGLLASILTSNLRPKDQMMTAMRTGQDRFSRTETIIAIQRALTKIGLGPLRDDGTMGPGTRAALDRFEQNRNLPSRAEHPERVIRALQAASGIAIP